MGVTLSHLKAKEKVYFLTIKEGSTMLGQSIITGTCVVIEQYAWWFEPLL
jgi:SOS-response transcriptional repressor LexA